MEDKISIIAPEEVNKSTKAQKLKKIGETLKEIEKHLKENEEFEEELLKNSDRGNVVSQCLLEYNKNLQRDCSLLHKIVIAQKKKIKESSEVISKLHSEIQSLEIKIQEREQRIFTLCNKYLVMKEKRDERQKKFVKELKVLEKSVDKNAGKRIEILESLLLQNMNRTETLEDINAQLMKQDGQIE